MKKKVLFAVIDNGMGLSRTTWAVSFASALAQLPAEVEKFAILHLSYPYPNGSMNMATALFMASEFDWLVTIDTDLVFEPQHLAFLLSHEVPFVAGLYPKKIPGTIEFPAGYIDGVNPFTDQDKLAINPLVELTWVARGFTLIHREVFSVVGEHRPMWTHPQTNQMHPEWWTLLPGGHSEDLEFCEFYRSHGGRILVDSRCTVKHEGTAVYPILHGQQPA